MEEGLITSLTEREAEELSASSAAEGGSSQGGAGDSLPHHITRTLRKEEETRIFNKVFRLHLVAALFFTAQTIGYVVGLPDASITPTTAFPIIVGGPIGNPSQQSHPSFNPCWLIVTFVLLAAIDHTTVTLLAYLRPQLVKDCLFIHQTNPLRWIEYFFSASLMLIAISMLSGVHDVHLWFCIGCLNGIGIITGQFLELFPRANRKITTPIYAPLLVKLTYWLGSFAILAPWLVILCYFFQPTFSPPSFVYVAFLGTLVLFTTFACNAYLHHIYGKYPFYTAEVTYVILSFTAKTLLAADVFGGVAAASKA